MGGAIRVQSVVFPETKPFEDYTDWFIEKRVSSKVAGSRSNHFRTFLTRMEAGV